MKQSLEAQARKILEQMNLQIPERTSESPAQADNPFALKPTDENLAIPAWPVLPFTASYILHKTPEDIFTNTLAGQVLSLTQEH